jgi:hypothetical protein
MGGFLRRVVVRSGIAAAFVVLLTTAGAAHHPHGETHSSGLAGLRVDVLADGKVVVSSAAGGDLAGLLTLTLSPTANGSYSGTWAMTVAHADNTDPQTGVEPPAHGHADHGGLGRDHAADSGEHGEPAPHQDFVRLVHRGALGGTVNTASLQLGADGGLAALEAQLSVGLGTLEFHGASGSGHATLTELTLAF